MSAEITTTGQVTATDSGAVVANVDQPGDLISSEQGPYCYAHGTWTEHVCPE